MINDTNHSLEFYYREAISMIKVLLLLKKSDHLSQAEFYDWWLNKHAPHVVEDQAPYLQRYLICTRDGDWDSFPTGIAQDDEYWDGVAVLYFRGEADFRAIYTRKLATTSDTLKHVKEIKRLIMREHEIDTKNGTSTVLQA